MKKRIRIKESDFRNIVKKCVNEAIESYDKYSGFKKDVVNEIKQLDKWVNAYLPIAYECLEHISDSVNIENISDCELQEFVDAIHEKLQRVENDVYKLMKNIKRVPVANTMYGD